MEIQGNICLRLLSWICIVERLQVCEESADLSWHCCFLVCIIKVGWTVNNSIEYCGEKASAIWIRVAVPVQTSLGILAGNTRFLSSGRFLSILTFLICLWWGALGASVVGIGSKMAAIFSKEPECRHFGFRRVAKRCHLWLLTQEVSHARLHLNRGETADSRVVAGVAKGLLVGSRKWTHDLSWSFKLIESHPLNR